MRENKLATYILWCVMIPPEYICWEMEWLTVLSQHTYSLYVQVGMGALSYMYVLIRLEFAILDSWQLNV